MLWAMDEDNSQPVPEAQTPPGSREPEEVILEVQGLGRSYGETRALDGLSFRVHAGEVLGLVGPNGAGKTTALRSIAGILPIREGSVRIAGFDVQSQEVQAKQRLGWVPDDPQPFETLTVLEHLEFTASLYGVKDWEARAEELLETFELGAKRDALGGELSRGMRQKLAIACAWLPAPKLVLLDEPLSGLDPRGIRSARLAIEQLADSGTALILSSHQLELVEALADTLLIVNQGRPGYMGTLAGARASLGVGDSSSLEEIFFAATSAEVAENSRDAFLEGEAGESDFLQGQATDLLSEELRDPDAGGLGAGDEERR